MTRMFRNNDPDTSRAAKRRGIARDQNAVLEVHTQHPNGLTDYDLAGIMGRQQNSVGKRRTELRDKGFVEATPLRRPAPSGSLCIVWRITPAGMAEYRSLIFSGRTQS